jgi:hypothetical protein
MRLGRLKGYAGQLERRTMTRTTWRRCYRNARRVASGVWTGVPALPAAMEAVEWSF